MSEMKIKTSEKDNPRRDKVSIIPSVLKEPFSTSNYLLGEIRLQELFNVTGREQLLVELIFVKLILGELRQAMQLAVIPNDPRGCSLNRKTGRLRRGSVPFTLGKAVAGCRTSKKEYKNDAINSPSGHH
tara:strand:+ start:908 stop:1294 length:387 start_codon:yes stop_codon:yes gene_type:complete